INAEIHKNESPWLPMLEPVISDLRRLLPPKAAKILGYATVILTLIHGLFIYFVALAFLLHSGRCLYMTSIPPLLDMNKKILV
ncbi:MAG TPA: hypothetical protein VGO47_00970, partial [Chlamydiales bacterium]|nr:hypothetical protein [Chlamydiales bacterium]